MVWQFLLRDHPPTVQLGSGEISVDLPVEKLTQRGFVLYNSEGLPVDTEEWELPPETGVREQFNVRLAAEAQETSVFIRLYNSAKREKKLTQCIIYQIDYHCDLAGLSDTVVKIDGTDYRGMRAEEAITMMSGEETLRMDEQAYKADPSRCSFIGNGYQYDLHFDQHGVKLKEIRVSKTIDFIDDGGK